MTFVRRNATQYVAENATNLYNTEIELDDAKQKEFESFSDRIKNKKAFGVYIKFFPIITSLLSDEQDTLRILAVEELYKLLKLLMDDFTPLGHEKIILPLVIKILNDESWKVRTVCPSIIIKVFLILQLFFN